MKDFEARLKDQLLEDKVGSYEILEDKGGFIVGIWVERQVSNGWLMKKSKIISFEPLTITGEPLGNYGEYRCMPPPLPEFDTLEAARKYSRQLIFKRDEERKKANQTPIYHPI